MAHIFKSLKLDILSGPAEVVSFFCGAKIFNIIYLFLQVADWWLTTAARLINVECGMGVPASSVKAFTIRRLVTDYGRFNVATLGRLSISGTVTYATVLNAFVRPNVYMLSILYTLMSRRPDMELVKLHLDLLINTFVEVIPVVLLASHANRQLYVYIFKFFCSTNINLYFVFYSIGSTWPRLTLVRLESLKPVRSCMNPD